MPDATGGPNPSRARPASEDESNMQNPYAPGPSGPYGAAPPHSLPPATRTARLIARILDRLLVALACIPGVVLAAAGVIGSGISGIDDERAVLLALPGAALAVAGALILSIYQWLRIAASGQTIGKRMLGVRIVRVDGTPVDFGSGVLMRVWVNWLLNFVPFYGIADALFILTDERRCIHDLRRSSSLS